VVRHVRGIVRVAIGKLWNHVLEGVEHVEVGSGIKIGGGQRGGRV
jgi:hypothetical protein